MRLYADNDVEASVVEKLRKEGHEVLFVQEHRHLVQLEDKEHALNAEKDDRVIVCADRDYSELREVQGIPTTGVVYIRGAVVHMPNYEERVAQVIRDKQDELERGAFVTLRKDRVIVREFSDREVEAAPEAKRETIVDRMRRLNPFTEEQREVERQRLERAAQRKLNQDPSRQRTWEPDKTD